MPGQPGVSQNHAQPSAQTKATATAQPQRPSVAPSARAPNNAKPIPSDGLSADLRSLIPKELLNYEPVPREVFDENPLLNERSAAVLLDVSAGLLKKWRQRNWGPNYIQYGDNGPVRYEFAALMEFRNRNRIETRSKR